MRKPIINTTTILKIRDLFRGFVSAQADARREQVKANDAAVERLNAASYNREQEIKALNDVVLA
mgnify:CR=1 FL=1